MRCERCDQGDLVEVRRAKAAEHNGKVAVVRDVPMEECPACGERWISWDVAARLDDLLTELLAGKDEVSTKRFPQQSAA